MREQARARRRASQHKAPGAVLPNRAAALGADENSKLDVIHLAQIDATVRTGPSFTTLSSASV